MAVGERGRARDTIRIALEGLALFDHLNRPQFAYLTLVYLALAHALNGEPEKAGAALVTLDGLDLSVTFYMGIDLLLARAWTAVGVARRLPACRGRTARSRRPDRSRWIR